MWTQCAPILSILLLCLIALDKSEAQNSAAAAAAAAASADTGGHTDPDPPEPPQNPIVEEIARQVSDGLLNSQVFPEEFTTFDIKYPRDFFVSSGKKLLAKAGIKDPHLIKVVADAATNVAKKLGSLDSKLYFDSVGYFLATFLLDKGIATTDNPEYLALQLVTSMEVVVCVDGYEGLQSGFDAVVYGFFYVLDSYGLISYDNMQDIFYRYAAQVQALAGITTY